MVNDINITPYILSETEDFAVVYKPPRMHSAPLQNSGGDTLVDWYAAQYPAVMELSGKRGGEGGLLHRLDFETHGLVLFAKNQPSLDFLLTQQNEGNFIKEYSAVCQESATPASFPPAPLTFPPPANSVIESFFHPYGPGRKQVRPVTGDDARSNGDGRKAALIAKDHGGPYRTEIVNIIDNITTNGHYTFTVKIKRGFRHQIRCHLAWIGCPVLNDPIYGEGSTDDFLALRSHALFFPDPASGEQREYSIVKLSAPQNALSNTAE